MTHENNKPNRTKTSAAFASARRILICLLIAIPGTATVTGLLYFVAPGIAIGICVMGIALFSFGRAFNRVLLMGVGGVLMFGGVLSWALRQ